MKNKKVFITGATSGIGREIAELCIKNGYEVYATGRNESSLDSLSNLGAIVLKGDLCNKEDINQMCTQLPDIDVAILNAGVGAFQYAYELVDEEIEAMININVRAPIYLARNISQKMIHKRTGHIIFIGSQAGKVATKKASVYAASKHAITGFANGLRMELAPFNVKVSAVYPGPIDTPFIDKADSTKGYRKSITKYLLNSTKVAEKIIQLIERPKREINLPPIMSVTSKLYAVAPKLVETFGRSFFNKK